MIKVTLMIMVMTIKIMAIMMMIVHEVTHRHQPGDSAKPGMQSFSCGHFVQINTVVWTVFMINCYCKTMQCYHR